MNFKDPNSWTQLLPFVTLASARAGEHAQRPLVTRIVEGVIMGLAGGAMGTYITVQVMANDIQWLRSTVSSEIADIKSDLRRVEDRQFEAQRNDRLPLSR